MDSHVWDTVEEMLINARGMYYDGCHKIYLAMDDEQKEHMNVLGYDYYKPNLELLKNWFDSSCDLKFVSAVFANKQNPNLGFVNLIPQFYFEDLEYDDYNNPEYDYEEVD